VEVRVFVTGATGYIGSAVVQELLGAGHQVVGLARHDESARALEAARVEVRQGSIDDPAGLAAGAADAEGVVHLAFRHDFGDFAAAAQQDYEAVAAMARALEGSVRPLVIASGVAGVRPGQVLAENDPGDPATSGPRNLTEAMLIAASEQGVRSVAVRLPPTVHSSADRHGFVPRIIAVARLHGRSAYVGAGTQRWCAVHRLDAARIFRLALETAPPGTRLHAVGDPGVQFRAIAETIGRHLGVETESLSPSDAQKRFDWLAALVGADIPASSAATQAQLRWTPSQPGLLADLDEGHYFRAPAERAIGS
jgi:nucleoside-diphosphate-sugar epimerase